MFFFCRQGGRIRSENVTRFVKTKNVVKQVEECSTCVVFVYPQLHRLSVYDAIYACCSSMKSRTWGVDVMLKINRDYY